MSGSSRTLRNICLSLLITGLLGAPLRAQSIHLDKVNLTYDGAAHQLLPGGANLLEIPPPPNFNQRRAGVSLTTSYNGPAGVPFLVSCFIVFNAGLPIDTQTIGSAKPTGNSGSGVTVPTEGFKLVERITHTYGFFCELDRTVAPFGVIAKSNQIELHQQYVGEDSIAIAGATPDPAVPLQPGAWMNFEASVDYKLGSRGPSGHIRLAVTDAAGNVLIETKRTAPTTAGATGNLAVRTPAVQVPPAGPVQLLAELQFQRGSSIGGLPGNQLETLATAAPVPYQVTRNTDFTIDHIEVVQVVQDEVNSVPLVAGKDTVVRVFPKQPDASREITGVPVLVTMSTPGGQVLTIASPNAPGNAKISANPDRKNGWHSYNVPLNGATVPAGAVTFEATVNPGGTVEEDNTANNTKQVTVRFEPRRGVVIRYLPVCIQPPGQAKTCPSDNLGDFGQAMLGLYPAPRDKFSYSRLDGPELIWHEIPNTEEKRQHLFGRLERVFTAAVAASGGLIEYDQLVAWLPDKVDGEATFGGGLLGVAATRWLGQLGRVSINLDTSDQTGDALTNRIVVHEVAHNLGLRHLKNDPCGGLDPESRWPFPGDASIQEHGFDPIAWRVKVGKPSDHPSVKKDLMSYCSPPSSLWISPFHYRALFAGELLPQGAVAPARTQVRSATGGDFAYISGFASRDGVRGELEPISRFTGTAEPSVPEPGGEYCVRFADGGGTNLGEHCFPLSFRSSENGAKMDEQGFTQLVPFPTGTASVSLLRLGAVLDTISASGGVPEVQVTAPAAGDRWEGAGERTVSWTGSDPDGDALLYSLLYSINGGQTWTALAVDLTDSQFTFDPARIQGGSDVRFQVTATDGLNQRSAATGPITVVQQPQIAVDMLPVDMGEAVVGAGVTGAVTLRNAGTGPLTVASIVSDSEQFEILSPLPLSVSAGSTRDVLVSYTASALGAEAGTLTITSNATGNSEFAVAIQGTGADGLTPRIGLEAESLGFFYVHAGIAQTGAFTLENRSLVDLEATWSLSGSEVFTARTQADAVTIEPGATRVIEVTFSPPFPGEFTGVLAINTNDPARPTVVVPVTGIAVEPPPPTPAPAFSSANIVSAADFSGGRFAADMWVALFGENLADELIIPTNGLPSSLGGTSVTVTDSQGARRAAKLQFIAPTQVNFLIPAGTPNGSAVVELTNPGGETTAATIPIETVAPSLFTRNSQGTGAAAATYLRIDSGGNRTEGFTFDSNTGANGPFSVSPADGQVYLNFFGTGFRSQSSVSARIGGVTVPVLAAIAQGQFEGLDQAGVGPLPPELAGLGEVNVEFIFDGIAANTVTVNIK